MNSFISEQDQSAISDAIAAQERRTCAELVTVVADASDNYQYIPVLWASLLSMLLPGLLYMGGVWTGFAELYTLQVLCFLGLAIVFRQPFIRHRLIPRAVKHQRAARMARQQFIEQRLHHTEQRLGVLLFVSVAEHYVEILADSGASDKIDDQQWQRIVTEFSRHVAKGQVTEGFLHAISKCGDLLAEVAPQLAEPEDVLSNKLVILSDEEQGYLL